MLFKGKKGWKDLLGPAPRPAQVKSVLVSAVTVLGRPGARCPSLMYTFYTVSALPRRHEVDLSSSAVGRAAEGRGRARGGMRW